MNLKKQFYETLATSMIENFKKKDRLTHYCATKEEAVALANFHAADTGNRWFWRFHDFNRKWYDGCSAK